MAEQNGSNDAQDKPRKPSGLADVVRNYRLIKYVLPYKRYIALMVAIIIIYSSVHGIQALVIRELLDEGLWLPPEPPIEASIDTVINDSLPEPSRAEARDIVRADFADTLESALTEKEFKRLREEDIGLAADEMTKSPELAPAIHKLLAAQGWSRAPGATRRLWLAMGRGILAKLGPELTESERAAFGDTVEKAFQPPPGHGVDSRRIQLFSLALLGVAVVVGVTVYTRTLVRAWVISRATRDIRQALCQHLLKLDMLFFGDRSSGELISRQINDVVAGTKAMKYLFDDLLVLPFVALAYAVAAFIVSWQLSSVFIGMLLFLVFPVSRIARRIRRYGRQKLERIAELTSVMSEMFQGMRVIKAFRIERRKLDEFGESNEGYVRRLFKIMRLKGKNRAITETAVQLAVAGIMFLSSYLVTTGVLGYKLEAPDVLTFAFCMGMLARPIRNLARVYPHFMEAVAASERVFEILDVEPEIQEAPDAAGLPPVAKSISFRNITFAYEDTPVLDDISFEVGRGQVVAVVGHSGAGKSTLLDLIPRFYDPDRGCIEIDGVDIRKATLDSLRGQIAVVSQDPFLFQTAIGDNIRYGRVGATHDEVVDAAKAANIHDFITTLPEGYETLCGERGVKLSGGQRQRITIARAVLKDAPILILDEATSSLDAESQRLVRDALHRLMEHRTTFVIAHRLSTVQHAEKIIVLRDGRLVETGSHDELLDARGEYWRLYQTEFEGGPAA